MYRKLLELCRDFGSSSQILLKPFKIPDRRVPPLNIVLCMYRVFLVLASSLLFHLAKGRMTRAFAAINHGHPFFRDLIIMHPSSPPSVICYIRDYWLFNWLTWKVIIKYPWMDIDRGGISMKMFLSLLGNIIWNWCFFETCFLEKNKLNPRKKKLLTFVQLEEVGKKNSLWLGI